VTTALYKSK